LIYPVHSCKLRRHRVGPLLIACRAAGTATLIVLTG